MALLTTSKKANENYCAEVVQIKSIIPHSNADKLALTHIFGNTVIIGKDLPIGTWGVYFPSECQISEWFLSEMNLYSSSIRNKDVTKKGYFAENGRLKATKLRGEISNGLFIPLSNLPFIVEEKQQSFDTVDDRLLVKKYIVVNMQGEANGEKKVKDKSHKLKGEIVEGQFKFHFETAQLLKNLHKLQPNDYIVITSKVHGSSSCISHVLLKKKLKWWEKLLKKAGVKIVESEYGYVWSSGKPKSGLVKGTSFDYKNPNKDYYSVDIWKQAYIDHKDSVKKGITIYSELVGYAGSKGIQGKWVYGCKPGEYKMRVYRITYTNVDGYTVEFSWQQVLDYCNKHGLIPVETYFSGFANQYKKFTKHHWVEDFANKLKDEFLEKTLPDGMPDEGICIRIEKGMDIEILKYKSQLFVLGESIQLDEQTTEIEA